MFGGLNVSAQHDKLSTVVSIIFLPSLEFTQIMQLKWNIHLWALSVFVPELYATVCVVLRFYTGNFVERFVEICFVSVLYITKAYLYK